MLRAKVVVFVQLWQLRDEAARAGQVRAEFMATLAHDLRAPIGVVSGYLSLVEDGSFGEGRASAEGGYRHRREQSGRGA